MSEIVAGGRFVFSDVNTPTRVGELINTLSEIYDIPTPRVGMRVYVRDEEKEYIIRSLKSKVVGGVTVSDAAVDEYEPASDTLHVEWSEGMSLNDFTKEGVFSIKGLRRDSGDGLPIANVGKNASFAAKLFVTVTPEGTTVYRHIIGQTLILSNAEGNETKIYTRSGKSVTPNDESIEWSAWTMMQGNREVGAVGSLDEFTDNGIYSGVWGKKAGEVETFVMVVINDYVVVGGDFNRVTQFKYAFNSLSASKKSLPSFMSRACSADGEWSEWEIINKSEISALVDNAVRLLEGAIASETDRAVIAEEQLENAINGVKNYAARVDGNAFIATANEVKLTTTGVDTSKNYTVTLPAATESRAGVMSAEDKEKLNNITPGGGDITAEETDGVVNNIEESVVASALRKTPQVLTEDEKLQARENIDAQKELTLTIKDNGNIVIGNIQGETKEFMPATPSGDPMHYAYIAAGAEYNDTDNIIEKTAPWKTDEVFVKNNDGTYTYSEVPAIVEHLPKHYYLNGLGDITEQEMLRIYNYTFALSSATDWTNVLRQVSIRTNIFKDFFYAPQIIKNINAAFYGATLDVLFFSSQNINVTPTTISYLLTDAKIKRIVGVIDVAKATNTTHIGAPKLLDDFRLKNLKTSVNFSKISSVYKRSILYLIENAAPTSAITITLHPDAHARIVNQPDILAALEAQPLVSLSLPV